MLTKQILPLGPKTIVAEHVFGDGDAGLRYEVRLYVRQEDRWEVKLLVASPLHTEVYSGDGVVAVRFWDGHTMCAAVFDLTGTLLLKLE